ncbi:MAG: ABC transporter permease [Bacteroidetes bacterium]|nr:ABC transporter permease [Bacteroidota bacterium]
MRFAKIIYATIIKEWLILRRDPGGLLILLAMPALLILIMALVQDAPFRDYQNLQLKILVADEDRGTLSEAVATAFHKSPGIELLDSVEGMPLSPVRLRQLLQQGKYKIGLIIPRGAGNELANAANSVANSLSASMSAGKLPQRAPRDSMNIRLLFDPTTRPAFHLAIHAALDKAVSSASMQVLMNRLNKLAGNKQDTTSQERWTAMMDALSIRDEQTGTSMANTQHLNSVQHNVPAWAIFGMFFIVVPLGGHIVREREQGSALRVSLIPGTALGLAIGRILANTILCCLQFIAMCLVGFLVMPLVGLPALDLGAHPWAITPVVIATALCATAYGNLIGSVFRSGIQAVSFGAISIVILSALGGIWVPAEILPKVMQGMARCSPLHWGLEGIQNVILRQGSWADVVLPTTMLLGLSAILLFIGFWGGKKAEESF